MNKEFVLTPKKEQNNCGKCSAFASSHFCTYLFFTSKSVVFVDGGAKCFLPQGAGYPSYATGNSIVKNSKNFSERNAKNFVEKSLTVTEKSLKNRKN